MLTRRAALASLAALGVAPLGSTERSQAFSPRAVTIIVPYPAGGPVDVIARLLAQEATSDLGQPIVVDNRAGGGGLIGTAAAAQAHPDGYTLILGTNQTHATNQSLLKNWPYDAVRDFVPVAGLAEVPHVLVVPKEHAAKSVADLLAQGRAAPGALTYGSTGVGSASHLAAELFATRAGLSMVHVPFRGAAPMTAELLAGRINLSFATLPSVFGQIQEGALRALAVASRQRAPQLADVATLAESGIQGVEADAWFALFAPAGTPKEAVARLYAAIRDALGRERAREAVRTQGLTLRLRTPDELAASLPGEIAKWAQVIRAANVKVE